LGVCDADVKVARHKPEDFLIVFRHPHHREAALHRRSLSVGSGAKRAVARSCDLDYVEHRSLRREDMALCPDDTRALCLWAWTYNPSDIP
jgi:hypothetical protein